MAGYWQDEAATQAALRDGWLHTGDIGQFDRDGFLSIVGRLKEVIRSGASTIVPKEVEDVLLTHPAVAEVAVLGLPDAEWGEAVTAFVVARAGMPVSEHDLIEHCRARLASFKKPRAGAVRAEPAAVALRQGAARAAPRRGRAVARSVR